MAPSITLTAEVEGNNANTHLQIEENLPNGRYILTTQHENIHGDRTGTITQTMPTCTTRSIKFEFGFRKDGGDGRHHMGFVNTNTNKRVGYINDSEAIFKNEQNNYTDNNNGNYYSCQTRQNILGSITLTHNFQTQTSTMEFDYPGRSGQIQGSIDCTGWDWQNTYLFFHSRNGTLYVWDLTATLMEDDEIISTIPWTTFKTLSNWDAQPSLSQQQLYLSAGKNSRYLTSIEDMISSEELNTI